MGGGKGVLARVRFSEGFTLDLKGCFFLRVCFRESFLVDSRSETYVFSLKLQVKLRRSFDP